MAKSDATIPMPHVTQSGPVDLSSSLNFKNLHNLTILITGGASGLGAAFARHWATHGAHITIGDLNASLGEELIASLREATSNPNHHFISLDVTSWTSQLAFFEEAVRLSPHGGIDAVVAGAGINISDETQRFELSGPDAPDYHSLLSQGKATPPAPSFKTLDVNITGVLYTSHLALSYLRRNPGSSKCSTNPGDAGARDRHLLLISSIAGLFPVPSLSVYSVSKHAVTGLFRNLRMTAPQTHGVRVNLLCPYFTVTPILGLIGEVVLAGAGKSEVEGVVEAATRLVAVRTVLGRGLVIGPPVSGEVAVASELLENANGIGEAQRKGVWDVYAHDFEQSDLFARRVLGASNLVAAMKGWWGVWADLTTSIRRRLW